MKAFRMIVWLGLVIGLLASGSPCRAQFPDLCLYKPDLTIVNADKQYTVNKGFQPTVTIQSNGAGYAKLSSKDFCGAFVVDVNMTTKASKPTVGIVGRAHVPTNPADCAHFRLTQVFYRKAPNDAQLKRLGFVVRDGQWVPAWNFCAMPITTSGGITSLTALRPSSGIGTYRIAVNARIGNAAQQVFVDLD